MPSTHISSMSFIWGTADECEENERNKAGEKGGRKKYPQICSWHRDGSLTDLIWHMLIVYCYSGKIALDKHISSVKTLSSEKGTAGAVFTDQFFVTKLSKRDQRARGGKQRTSSHCVCCVSSGSKEHWKLDKLGLIMDYKIVATSETQVWLNYQTQRRHV